MPATARMPQRPAAADTIFSRCPVLFASKPITRAKASAKSCNMDDLSKFPDQHHLSASPSGYSGVQRGRYYTTDEKEGTLLRGFCRARRIFDTEFSAAWILWPKSSCGWV